MNIWKVEVGTWELMLASAAFVPMLLETARSARNERALRAQGAREPEGDVYSAMQLVYPSCFLAMIFEAALRDSGISFLALAGFIVFACAKALKYWTVHTLGKRWTFRVLVPPGSQRTVAGPYLYMRHPNYLAVVGELAGFALFAGAFWTGLTSLIAFGVLLVARIRVEERALGLRVD